MSGAGQGINFYARVLDEAEQLDFETAAGIDGIDDEITLLRMKIKSILEKGLDRQSPEPELPLSSPVHQNVRGQAYYAAASKTEGLC